MSSAATAQDCNNCIICQGADHFFVEHYLKMKMSLVKFLKEDTDLFDLCRTLATLLIGVNFRYINVSQIRTGLINMLTNMKPHLFTNFTVHAQIMAMCWIDIHHPHFDYTTRSGLMNSLQIVILDYVHHDSRNMRRLWERKMQRSTRAGPSASVQNVPGGM